MADNIAYYLWNGVNYEENRHNYNRNRHINFRIWYGLYKMYDVY